MSRNSAASWYLTVAMWSKLRDDREGSVPVSFAGVAALLVLATVRPWRARQIPVSGGVTLCLSR